MFHINGNSAWETLFGKHAYIFMMYLQTLDRLNFCRAQRDLKVCTVYVHMICLKLGRLINHGLWRAQSWPGLFCGNEPRLKYWLAMTKLQSLESVCLYSFHDTQNNNELP